ncbi:MAG: hypothetical protein ACQESR_06360 [Planctomycetota bacterium]
MPTLLAHDELTTEALFAGNFIRAGPKIGDVRTARMKETTNVPVQSATVRGMARIRIR